MTWNQRGDIIKLVPSGVKIKISGMRVAAVLERTVHIGRLMGLCLSKQNTTGSKYTISKWRQVYCFFLVFCFVGLSLIQAHTSVQTTFWDKLEPTQRWGTLYWIIMNPLVCIIAILYGVRHEKIYCDVVNDLDAVVQQISLLTGKEPVVSIAWYLVTLIGSALLAASCSLDYISWSSITEATPTLYLAIIISYVGMHLLIICAAFHELNEGLSKCLNMAMMPQIGLKDGTTKCIGKLFLLQLDEECHRYRSIYSDLFYVSQSLGDMFATIFGCQILHLGLVCTISMHSCIIYTNSNYVFQYLFVSIRWAVFGWSSITLIIYPCVTAMNKSMEIMKTVNTHLAKSKRDDVIQQLLRFSIILQNEKVNFTPHGIFTLNYSLLITMIGSVISYLVIITQISTQQKQNLD